MSERGGGKMTPDELEGLEYHGVPGGSHDCQDAVMRLLQFGDRIVRVRILTHANHHGLLLTKEVGDRVAIPSGFASGYGGAGPDCFSVALQLLDTHGAVIDECELEEALLERLDRSGLTMADVERIDAARPVRPSRWPDYVMERHVEAARKGTLWDEFPPVIPFAIIDSRLIDLARSFWDDPDHKLLKGYRRLEDIIRERTGLTEHGSRLLSKAFVGDTARLQWAGMDSGEKAGRGNLFSGAYGAHRNPRAHRELKSEHAEQLREFLLLNHLYHLEKEAEVQ
jgi:hypothetical protein